MADEKAQQPEAGAEGEKPKGGSKLPLIVGALVGVLVLGGGGAWWFGLLGGGGGSAEATEQAAPAEGHGGGSEAGGEQGGGHGGGGGDVGAMSALDPFIANLSDEEGRRYLKATLQVEFFKAVVPNEFNTRLPQIRDLLLTLLSSKTFAEVRTPQGKAVLRDEIVTRMNHAMRTDMVKAVYFTEFIVQ